MDYLRTKGGEEYYLQLVENFEKLLEDRRCKVRQEMMKFRIEIETEFRLNMKNLAFQSMMNLREKIYESKRKINNIAKENEKKIMKIGNGMLLDNEEGEEHCQDLSKKRECDKCDVKKKKVKNLLKTEASLENEMMKNEGRLRQLTILTKNVDDKRSNENDSYENEGNSFSNTWEMDNLLKELNDSNKGIQKYGMYDKVYREEIDMENSSTQESILDPKFLERSINDNVLPGKREALKDSDEFSSCFESSSSSVETIVANNDQNNSIENMMKGIWIDGKIPLSVESRYKKEEEQANISITSDEYSVGTDGALTEKEKTEEGTVKLDLNESITGLNKRTSLSDLMLNSSAESGLSGKEVNLPLSEADFLNIKTPIVKHFEVILNEKTNQNIKETKAGKTGIDTKATHNYTSDLEESRTGINKEIQNANCLYASNNLEFGFSPRSPSKYKQFKHDREIRKNMKQEKKAMTKAKHYRTRESMDVENDEFDSDDLWLVTPLQSPWIESPFLTKQGDDDTNVINKADNFVFTYDENIHVENYKEKSENGESHDLKIDNSNHWKTMKNKEQRKSKIPVKIKYKKN